MCGRERDGKEKIERWCNIKLGITVTHIGVRCQESSNTAASESVL